MGDSSDRTFNKNVDDSMRELRAFQLKKKSLHLPISFNSRNAGNVLQGYRKSELISERY